MTQTEASEPPQDEYENVAGGPGAPMPISQLSVRLTYHKPVHTDRSRALQVSPIEILSL